MAIDQPEPVEHNSITALALGALGVVFGDIGTSPLYAVRESLHAASGAGSAADTVYGVLSLIVWAVTLVVSLKYVLFMMRADNKGEGGILALMAMAAQAKPGALTRRRIIVGAAMCGAALFYGDAIITPTISVLSAIEGIEVVAPALQAFVVPLALLVLFGLFAIQSSGTEMIGRFSGPIMALYFVAIAALGITQIVQNPSVLAALNPFYGLSFLANHPVIGYVTLGSVFLAVTGAEAIYADMGHFGAPPIRLAWFVLVFPALLINYLGQGALVLAHPQYASDPFYLMVPHQMLMPMILLATLATVIASQAVISGAFSITRQAMQLGLLPRMRALHTSASQRGQIYMPAVNWLLMIAVFCLVLGFKNSSSLANAYGIAVTGTMVATSVLAFFIMRDVWNWSPLRAALVTCGFLIVDLTFFSANLMKLAQGGWLPVATGVLIAIVIATWRRGREILVDLRSSGAMPMDDFLKSISGSSIHRVGGTAVYMTPPSEGVPYALLHNMKHNRVLHERVILLTVRTEEVPRIAEEDRIEVTPLAKRFWRVVIRYGFMERPNVPLALALAEPKGLPIDMMQTSFFLGRENVVPSVHPRMALWRENLFIALNRLSQSAPDFYHIPANRVIEVGTKVEI